MTPMIPRADAAGGALFSLSVSALAGEPSLTLAPALSGHEVTSLTARTLFLMCMTCELAAVALPERSVGSQERRVRSDSAAITALVEAGSLGSATFKQLILAIEGTDGVVYVRRGKCPGYKIKGCLLHTMSATLERRFLWIALDLTGEPVDLMVTIAHELRHALEILSDGSIRTGRGIFSFYYPNGNPAARTVETAAALATGAAVRHELTQKTTSDAGTRKR